MLKQHDHQIRSTNAVHIQYECRFMERGHNITYSGLFPHRDFVFEYVSFPG